MNDPYPFADTQKDRGTQAMTPPKSEHISICVCTFQRPELLAELLRALLDQITNSEFRYSIIVVDNDRLESGRPTVEQFRKGAAHILEYSVEPEQSIALARNRAVAQATGDYIAFVDDDETPSEDWLYQLYLALMRSDSDGVLGPVKPCFASPPPAWILKAGIFDRPNSQNYPTGMIL